MYDCKIYYYDYIIKADLSYGNLSGANNYYNNKICRYRVKMAVPVIDLSGTVIMIELV